VREIIDAVIITVVIAFQMFNRIETIVDKIEIIIEDRNNC
jgi:hypothetical protein